MILARITRICDRCAKVTEDKPLDPGAVPSQVSKDPALKLIFRNEKGVTEVSFDDLCGDCQDALEKVVQRVELTRKGRGRELPPVLMEKGDGAAPAAFELPVDPSVGA